MIGSLRARRLMAEAPAILRWMIDGCWDWQANGLVCPKVITEATEAYFDNQDLMGQWLEEECDVEKGSKHFWEKSSKLFAAWAAYCKRSGAEPGTSVTFSDEMLTLEFTKDKKSHGIVWEGVTLKVPPQRPGSGGDDDRDY